MCNARPVVQGEIPLLYDGDRRTVKFPEGGTSTIPTRRLCSRRLPPYILRHVSRMKQEHWLLFLSALTRESFSC